MKNPHKIQYKKTANSEILTEFSTSVMAINNYIKECERLDYIIVKIHINYDELWDELPIGSLVDYRSLRNEDLLPAFLDLLSNLDESEYNLYLIEIGKNTILYPDCSIWDSEVAIEILHEVSDKLNNFVPEGYCFGASEGNGSDFGVWKYSEFENFC